MAEITVTVGPLTGRFTTTDAKAKRIFDLVYESLSPELNPLAPQPDAPIVHTAQQKLDLIADLVAKLLIERARARHQYKQRIINEQAISDELPGIGL